MSGPHTPHSFRPIDGGDLMTVVSEDRVGLANYTMKRDWRFDVDAEVRREGDVYFNPTSVSYTYSQTPEGPVLIPGEPDGEGGFGPPTVTPGTPLTLIFTARSPSGRTALIVGTKTTLYRYFYFEDGAYSASGYSDANYTTNLSGFWATIGTGFSASGHRWEAKNINGVAVFNNGFDLPVTYRLEDEVVRPLYELREQGIASVDTIEEHNGVLLCFGVTEIARDYLPALLLTTPYVAFNDPARCGQNRYRVIWSALGDPRRWAATVPVTMTEGSTAGTLKYPMASISAGDEVMVQGAGIEGGNLIATVQSVSGTAITLSEYARTAVTDALMARSDAEGMIVGAYDLQDDGSPILRGVRFQDRLVVFKEGGSIFVGEFTGDASAPFSFQRVHAAQDGETAQAPSYRWAIADNGRNLIYAGRDGFYTFDLVTRRPIEHRKLALCKNLFFDHVSPAQVDDVFATLNTLTSEVWFCYDGGTDDYANHALCYDYLQDRVSTLGCRYTAGLMIARPQAPSPTMGGAEEWMALCTAEGWLVQYGMMAAGSVWTRRGGLYVSELRHGYGDFGERFNEKGLTTYVLLLASQSPNSEVTVSLHGTSNPGGTVADFGTRTFYEPKVHNALYTHRMFHLLQDRITAQVAGNVAVGERVFEVAPVNSRSVVRK